jgi:isoleucyl-tRNA synthetase
MVSKLQNLRKELNFEVTDRIIVSYRAEGAAADAMAAYRDYIAGEVLAAEFAPGAGETELDINGLTIAVSVTKA